MTSAAVLAGGLSRRMGTNKALIELNGEPLIDRTLKALSTVFDDVFIVANDVLSYERTGAMVVTDVYKGAGSLGGVFTALVHSQTDNIFVCACDMPGLETDVIRRMPEPSGSIDVVAPFINKRPQPLHAYYSRRCTKRMEKAILGKELRIGSFLDTASVKLLDEAHFGGLPVARSVVNVNTPEELEAFFRSHP